MRVRYRIDGLLREVTVVPKPIQGPLISRIKIMCDLDISERRKPQDGRGPIRLERLEADTRVSSMPTTHGETVVIRLLRKETEKAKTLAEVAAAVLVDGYEVVAAGHLDEGLRMITSERPDLVLVDLPGIDPTSLLNRLLEAAGHPLPVLVMSATDDRHTRDRAATAGATGFIPKPFTEPQLRAEVAAVLRCPRCSPRDGGPVVP